MGRLLAQQLDRLDSLTSLLRRRVLPLMRIVKTLHLLRRELGPLERSLEQLLHAQLPTPEELAEKGVALPTDEELKALLKKIECPRTRLITEAERAYLKRLQGSCRVPIAGHGQLFEDDGRLRMRGLVGSIDGERLLSSSSDLRLEGRDEAARIEEARKLGVEVADALIAQGSAAITARSQVADGGGDGGGGGGGGAGGDGGGGLLRWLGMA